MFNNNSLNQISAALTDAGFAITGFSSNPWKGPVMKLRVVKAGDENDPSIPRKLVCQGKELEGQPKNRRPGEVCNLESLLGAYDWRRAIEIVQEMVRCNRSSMFNEGDFVLASFDVPEAEHSGVKFKELHIKDAKIVIVDIKPGRVVFNFDEIAFLSQINEKNTNKDGFSKSALGEYLNEEFLEAMNISDLLTPNKDGQDITLLTAFEVFGEDDDFKPAANYCDESYQFEYFKRIKNRIKVWEDDTYPYWLSSPTAAWTTFFAFCNLIGFASNNSAYYVFGCAPAFCVSSETHL